MLYTVHCSSVHSVCPHSFIICFIWLSLWSHLNTCLTIYSIGHFLTLDSFFLTELLFSTFLYTVVFFSLGLIISTNGFVGPKHLIVSTQHNRNPLYLPVPSLEGSPAPLYTNLLCHYFSGLRSPYLVMGWWALWSSHLLDTFRYLFSLALLFVFKLL